MEQKINENELEIMELVRFKRTETSNWEPGIMFNEGDIIIDRKGNAPEAIWDYQREDRALCISLKGLFDELQGWCYSVNDCETTAAVVEAIHPEFEVHGTRTGRINMGAESPKCTIEVDALNEDEQEQAYHRMNSVRTSDLTGENF